MMGRYVRPPCRGDESTDESDESQTQLGDLLSDRDVDSVVAVGER